MIQFNTIPEALEDLRQGKLILVTDDPERENEGDFICAAEFATTENVNFMATHGKGLICMPMSEYYVRKLGLPQMVQQNTDNHETAFTVSIDHVSTTTGISAAERSITAMACVQGSAKPEDFRRPGHMFPLLAKKNGVLERNGHTEATVDLCRLAGLKECGLCCEIMREDGTMMRTPELAELFGRKPGSRGVKCQFVDGKISIDVLINVSYGGSITEIASGVQDAVCREVESITGMDCVVNVHVTGISFDK